MNDIARIRGSDGKIQSIAEHLRNTAEICRSSLDAIGLGTIAYITGLIHDVGKFSDEFGEYIRSEGRIQRGSVNHSAAGAMYIYNRYYIRAYEKKDKYMSAAAQMIIDAIYCHHTRLFDCVDTDAKNVFMEKMESKSEIDYRSVMDEFFRAVVSEAEYDVIFRKACGEIKEVISKAGKNQRFTMGMIQKLLYSVLIDADRYDAYCFEAGKEPMSADIPDWRHMAEKLDKRISRFNCAGAVNRMRKYISDCCLEAADRNGGVYRLSVPTGAGKTLASLRYALNCPGVKSHVYYVIPYTSILDQTAEEVTMICGDENVVVHHSGIVIEDNDIRHQIFTERWTAPVILTTFVQFMNSIYAGKPTCMRRFRALCNSVIVFDEVQAMPKKVINLFSEAVNFLVRVCGCTVLLCTATQPALDKLQNHPLALAEKCDIVNRCDEEYTNAFRRTKIVNMCSTGGMSCREIAEFAERQLEIRNSVLVIMNTVSEAKNVYKQLCGDETKIFMSTKKCAANRKENIRYIKEHTQELYSGKCKDKLIVVSTQLVEAGVDFSFECVIRALAGLDNAAQAAGRCNRSGEFGKICEVYLINVKGEDLKNLKDIERAKQCSMRVLRELSPEDDILSPEIIAKYYKEYFKIDPNNLDEMDFICEGSTIMEMLSTNKKFVNGYIKIHHSSEIPMLCQAFETAGKKFNVIESIGNTVIVPYGEGAEYIEALRNSGSIADKARILKRCRDYSVDLFEYEFNELVKMNALSRIEEPGVWTLAEGFYDDEYGIRFDGELEFMSF